MSSAADRIKANAERLRAKTPANPPAGDLRLTSQAVANEAAGAVAAASLSPAPVVRQKNVRRTVDLSPTAHRALDAWQSHAADRLGLARVTGQEVLAVLVDRLLNDAELAEQVIQAIAANR